MSRQARAEGGVDIRSHPHTLVLFFFVLSCMSSRAQSAAGLAQVMSARIRVKDIRTYMVAEPGRIPV